MTSNRLYNKTNTHIAGPREKPGVHHHCPPKATVFFRNPKRHRTTPVGEKVSGQKALFEPPPKKEAAPKKPRTALGKLFNLLKFWS